MNTKPQLRPLASYLTLGPAGLKDLSGTPDADSIITATLNLGDLLLRKNSFYGGSFRNKSILSNLPAEEAIKLRIDDKLKRLKRHLDNPENGDPEDTINDLAGYFLLWGIVRQTVQPQTPADVVRQQQEASQGMFAQESVSSLGSTPPAVAISTGVGSGGVKGPVESSRSSADMAGVGLSGSWGGPGPTGPVGTEGPCGTRGDGGPESAFQPAIITAEDILRETNIAFRHGSIETPGVKAKILDMILHYKITLNLYGRERHTGEHHLVCTVEDFLKHGPDGAKLLMELTVRDYIQSIDKPNADCCLGIIPAPGTKVKIETITDGVYLITTSRG